MKNMDKVRGSFKCGEEGHWKNNCSWSNTDCINGRGDKIRVLWSKKEHSKECRFFKCKSSPKCQGFRWVDVPPSQTSNASTSQANVGSTLKVTISGPTPIII